MIDFGEVVVNTTATRSVAVTNQCGVDVSVTISDVSGSDSLWFGTVPAHGKVLELKAGATSSITVQYTPLVAGPTESLASFALGLCESGTGCWTLVSLRGSSVSWELVVGPMLLDFGQGSTSTSSVLCISISNPANVPIHLTADPAVLNFNSLGERSPIGPFQAASVQPTKDTIIAPGESFQFCVTFSPPNPGVYQGEVEISTDDATSSNIEIPLTGFLDGPSISCTPSWLGFGAVPLGNAKRLSVSCTNTGVSTPDGNGNLLIQSLSIQNGNSSFEAAFDQPFPAAGLPSGQSAQIDVTYTPTGLGTDLDTLILTSNDSVTPETSFTLIGNGQ